MILKSDNIEMAANLKKMEESLFQARVIIKNNIISR